MTGVVVKRLLLAAALSLVASGAMANGRFPAAQFVVAGPGREGRTLALRSTFGVFISDDGGGRWAWRCEEELAYSGRKLWDPPLALGRDGGDGVPVFVGVPDGMWRDRTRCGPERVSEVGMEYTGDVTADPTGTQLYWASAGYGRPSIIFASDDGGRTWSRRYAGQDVLFETVESAPSDAARVYLTGIDVRDGFTRLYRSDDGARTLVAMPVDLRGGRDAFIAGVAEGDRDTLWLRVPARDDDGGTDGTLLLRSSDGGRRFDVLHRTRGPMLGFAYDDRGTLWVGGPDDGLLRSRGGAPFVAISTEPVRCLRWHADTLYLCGDLAAGPVALYRSRDEGVTREPLLRVDALTGPSAACAPTTPAQTLCAPRWPAVRRGLLQPMGVDAGVGAPPAASPRAPSAGCASSPRATGLSPGLAACLALLARRRRGR